MEEQLGLQAINAAVESWPNAIVLWRRNASICKITPCELLPHL